MSSGGSKGRRTYWPGFTVRRTFGMSTPFQVMIVGSRSVTVPSSKLCVRRIGFIRGCGCNRRAAGRASMFARLRGVDWRGDRGSPAGARYQTCSGCRLAVNRRAGVQNYVCRILCASVTVGRRSGGRNFKKRLKMEGPRLAWLMQLMDALRGTLSSVWAARTERETCKRTTSQSFWKSSGARSAMRIDTGTMVRSSS